jgi:ATP-dependent DNA helicase RecG
MPENQNIEYKSSWHDDYLKWICGFANAQGGTIFIGKDDSGKTVGLTKTKKLLEDLPNKIRDVLGIIPEINLRNEKGKEFIEIIVESYPSPVSLRGQYYYRSGSTKQELKGPALEKFLLAKVGRKWDGVITDFTVKSTIHSAFEIFRKEASKRDRVPEADLKESDSRLLEDLHLTEKQKLKRAAVILFCKDPEMLVTGAYVKVGFFKSDDDLLFHNEIHGALFHQVETTLDLLFTKYFKETISYTRSTRTETDIYPEAAIRETLLNALTHKDYTSGVPVQISVYDDKIIFWNPGTLPEHWTVANLKAKHASLPPNPDIASTFFRCGYIDTWGRGTLKLINACLEHGLPEPSFEFDGAGISVVIRRDVIFKEVLEQRGLASHSVEILLYVKKNKSIANSVVQTLFGVSKRTATRYLSELEGAYLVRKGETGKGTEYKLKGT